MKKIDVCFSPQLISQFNISEKIVVVADIFRATSCMTTAMAHGIENIYPVSDLETCKKFKEKGFLTAAEREGKKAKGFDFGNSPFNYMDPNLKGKSLAITTTNGTMAISKARDAKKLFIGSFLNLHALINQLWQEENDILVICAGWKGKFNLEDTLFAGALVEEGEFIPECDAPLAASTLYNAAKKDLLGYLAESSHAKRLQRLHSQKDIQFCLTRDKYSSIPELSGEKLINSVMDFQKEPLS